MNATEKFHEAKMDLESALIDFFHAAEVDGRDLKDELNEALFNAGKQSGIIFVAVNND